MQSVYEPEAMAVVGVAGGVRVASVGSTGGVGDEGASGVEAACARIVMTMAVAITDLLSAEGPHAPGRKLVTTRREIKAKVRFILVLSAGLVGKCLHGL